MALIVGLAVGVFAAPAIADPAALQLSQDAAESYWGPTPCVNGVQIGYAPAPENPSGPVAGPLWAVAQWTITEGVYTSCLIMINSTQFPIARQAARFQEFCGLIVHEYSHFEGYNDSPSFAPTSITYAYVTAANEHVAPCVARYGQAAQLAADQEVGTLGALVHPRSQDRQPHFLSTRPERRSQVRAGTDRPAGTSLGRRRNRHQRPCRRNRRRCATA